MAEVVVLTGCGPVPLACYLKALGVFRVISEQADASARGWWYGDVFQLESILDADGLSSFLLEQYSPTPLVAPWNGGSGYYPKDAKAGIEALAAAETSRLQDYAETICCCGQILAKIGFESPPKGEDKAGLLTLCRNNLPDRIIVWLDAAYALTQEGPKYPPLLGTGGNDGRLEFTNNFMQRLVNIIDPLTGSPTAQSAAWLHASLFGSRVEGLLADKPIGQFLPGSAGGANASAGFDGYSLVNPWDFVLLLEGTIVFAGTITRRLSSAETGVLSYPFTVRIAEAGYGTAASGDTRASRAYETWVPLWEQPASYREVAALFAEGRATVGQRVARDGVDFARAVRSLGVDRGIAAFERFGYLQRNGQAYIAARLGRWAVPRQASSRVGLIDETDAWFSSLERAARSSNAPAALGRAARGIKDAIMGVCRQDTTSHWQELLAALGAAERALIRSPKTAVDSRLKPLPPLSPGWLEACDDKSPEFRLAVSLASIRGDDQVGPLRANMVPLDLKASGPRFDSDNMSQPAVVWGQTDLCASMVAALLRRCLDARRLGLDALPFTGNRPARLEDVSAFIYGHIDDRKLEALLWGLNAARICEGDSHGDSSAVLPAGYAMLKLVHLPGPLRTAPEAVPVAIPYESEILRLAGAGRLAAATRLAAQRLHGSGLRPAAKSLHEKPAVARRITAALLFPLSEPAVQQLCRQVLLPAREPSMTV